MTPLLDPALLDMKGRLTSIEETVFGEFLGGPLVRMLHFHCQGHGFNPWPEN